MEPILLEFKLDEFELNLLPVDPNLLKSDRELLRSAAEEYLCEAFQGLPGELRVASTADRIAVQWLPHSVEDVESLTELAIALLQQGAFSQAEPILKALVHRFPDHPMVLFNYGMMLSDQGRLEEARERLGRLVKANPHFANGWVALGVVLSRQGNRKEAAGALERGVELDPENGYALRNLGALLAKEDAAKALPYLARAAELMPSDQAALYGYGECLLRLGRLEESDPVLMRAIALNEHSEIAELSREARTRIAHHNMRDRAPGGVRMDVVMYCLAALEKFKELGPEKTRAITVEIALLGRSGLDINDPSSRYHLNSLPGGFSGMQLVSYMYVGMRTLMPDMDPGIDLAKEYEMALQMSGAG